MGLESASYISQLVPTNPTGGDPKSSSDDHHRLTKTVLQTQFPNLGAAAVTLTAAEINASVATATAAAAAAGATVFNAATAYAQYAAAISTLSLQTYRRNTAGTSATDPSLDSTNWTRISGNVLVNTAVESIGYATGAGGTVTQATSKSTAVTLNKPTGVITTTADSLAGGATAQFVLNNTLIAITDIVAVSIGVSGSATYQTWVSYTSTGLCYISVKNNTGGALAEAVKINFAIIRGASA